MDKRTADKIITEYTGKLFGFALSKTRNISEAEDLASRIVLEVYSSLLKRESIGNINGYIYSIAHNVYARYTGEAKANRSALLSLDELNIPTDYNFTDELIRSETYRLLRREIAYLSKIQREIVVLHYYEKMKLSDIAEKLSLPLGTVKWHLFEAKNNLKEGLNCMRKVSDLGVNPIRFTSMGHCGMPGKLGDTGYFLKRRLTQNIAYEAYHEPKSIREIAEALGVSPLFVEEEVAVLEEYGFMDKVSGDKYLTNIYITEPTKEILEKEHQLYNRYAGLVCEKYVPLLFEAMKDYDRSEIYVPQDDFNFLMWSVITYACGYKLIANRDFSLESFSVKRKDGGDYIAFATVETDIKLSYDSAKYSVCGNMTRGSFKYPLMAWQLDTYYDSRKGRWMDNLTSDYEWLYEFITGVLKKEESQVEKYQRLFEKGYLADINGKDMVNVVVIKDRTDVWLEENDFTRGLPGITDELKAISDEFDHEMYELQKVTYPSHMQKLCKAWTTNCLSGAGMRTRVLEQLQEKGILKPLTDIQKRGVNTLMFCDALPG